MNRAAMDKQTADISKLKIDWNRPAENPRSAPGRGRAYKAAAVFLVAVLIGAFVYFREDGPVAVTVASVTSAVPGQSGPVLMASGYAVAQRRADVASKGTGRLVELNVREGDRVKKGAILARLESGDMAASLAHARANLSVAESGLEQALAEQTDATQSYERKKSLIASGMIPRADFEAAEARRRRALASVGSAEAGVKAAAAAVQSAEVDLENTVIRAPFDGTVLTKNADVGEVVAPFGSSSAAKAAVVTMADMRSLQVEADVSESNLGKIQRGQNCEIVLDAFPDSKYDGIVEAIVPTVDRAKATVLIKIRFLSLDDRVLPEMSARVAFLGKTAPGGPPAPVIAVPQSAVTTRDNRPVAFVVQSNRVRERAIEAGAALGGLVEIRAGLEAGELVVVHPPEGLRDGGRIEILSK